MNFILQTPTGFVVAGKAANFPKLADLEGFIDLKPVGFAAGAIAAINSRPLAGVVS